MKHLIDRFREGRISVSDFDALQDWLNSDPEVPMGEWYKRFPKFFLLTRLSQLAAYGATKPFVFSGGFPKVCTTF